MLPAVDYTVAGWEAWLDDQDDAPSVAPGTACRCARCAKDRTFRDQMVKAGRRLARTNPAVAVLLRTHPL